MFEHTTGSAGCRAYSWIAAASACALAGVVHAHHGIANFDLNKDIELKGVVTDIELMFSILAREPEIEDVPGAKPIAVSRGAIRSMQARRSS